MDRSGGARPTARVTGLVMACIGLFAAAGCDSGASGSVATIESSRVASKPFFRVVPGATLADRIGASDLEQRKPVPADDPSRQLIPFVHAEMPGWTARQPVAPFRHVNLRYDADPRAELTVAAYQDRGGLVANVNRWRRQVKAEPLSEAEIAALPKATVLGNGQATLVEVYGPFQGMSGPAIESGGILGAIVSNQQFTLFVKFVGPEAVLTAERDAFMGFLSSLRPGSMPDAPATGGATESKLKWETPAGWAEEPPTNQFRERTFRKGGVEIALSLARGLVSDNVNRWAGQLGLDPLDDAAVAELPKLPSMGTEAVIYEGVGTYQGMGRGGARADQRVLAAIVQIPNAGGTIATLKAVGPNAEVDASRADFAALLASLAVRGR